MLSGTRNDAPDVAPDVGSDRFKFGANWSRFARDLDRGQVDAARASLSEMLGAGSLAGRTFLDIGSGSGLFSLAATELGADRVESFDYDEASVATTQSLKDRFAPEASNWGVSRGSVLDEQYMQALGQWDVVYSWGVLHHTGSLWPALGHTCERVAPGGRLFIAIYNDQGAMTKVWTRVKRIYNRLPSLIQPPYAMLVSLPAEALSLAVCLVKLKPGAYFRRWTRQHDRGMSGWHDMIDWVGGYPFEAARPEEIFDFCATRGFVLRGLKTCAGGHGCNEYVFERAGNPAR